MDYVLYALAACIFLFFGSFAIASYREGELRATWISWLFAGVGGGVILLLTRLEDTQKSVALILFAIFFLVILLLAFLPIGRIKADNDHPKRRFDERDIMFARARLEPGSPNYEAYYQIHPENRNVDDATRAKPGLLSADSKLANEYLFAAPEASFTLTEVMGELVAGEPTGKKLELPVEEMTRYIRGLATFYGELDVGVTELKPYHVYSHVGRGPGEYGELLPVEHKYAIAFTVEMSHEMVGVNQNPPGVMETARQYVEAGRVAVQLAEAIRQLGHPARAHIDGNYRVIAPLVARDAGLGEIGRISMLMTPGLGPRVRLGVVTTDLDLLVEDREPDMSVIDFCTICKKCAENCPSSSIPINDRQESDGVLRWRINPESCFMYWNVIGTDCGICMTVCPYSHPDSLHHNLLRWGIKRSGFIRRGALLMDDVFYGKKPQQKASPEWTQVP
jgi:ferredoxin